MRRGDAVEFAKNLPLYLKLLGCRFNDKVAFGKVEPVERAMNAPQCSRRFLRGQLALCRLAVEVIANCLDSAIEKALLDLAEPYFQPGAGENVGNPIAHRSGTQHAGNLDFSHSQTLIYI